MTAYTFSDIAAYCYMAGFAAGSAGADNTSSPFSRDSDEDNAWMKGWLYALVAP